MSVFSFLFGSSKKTGVGERVSRKAHKELEGRVVKNAFNTWWAVLIRLYIIRPLLKLPFLPVAIAGATRSKTKLFKAALDVFEDKGKPTATFYKSAKNPGSIVGLTQLIGRIVWLPRGNPVAAERQLCSKLYWFTAMLWLCFAGCWGWAVYEAYNEGYYFFKTELLRIYNSGDLSFMVRGKSLSLRLVAISCALWSAALVGAVLLSARPWLRKSAVTRALLVKGGLLRGDGAEHAEVLAIGDIVYLNSALLKVSSVRAFTGGWHGDFRPGQILESSRKSSEMVVIKRPKKEPIVFGGPHSNSEIRNNLKPYEQKLLAPMKGPNYKSHHSEQLLLGEVVDNRWWKSSQIYTALANNPHVAIIGQTRSGKSKTALSFVYSFARSFPDTVWFFADGKSSPDYDPFAEKLSQFPVAKKDGEEDSLIQLANVIEEVWQIYMQRVKLFKKAALEGVHCSTIYEYRRLVGPLPQVWLVIDEFASFNAEMDFAGTFNTQGTLSNRLKKFCSEGASYGIHILLASQRYQETDFPTPIRSNLTTVLVHSVQLTDSRFLEMPEAPTLERGQFFIRTAGVYCEHTGISTIRAKLPYIGDEPAILLQDTIKSIDPAKKREFDRHLLYQRGNNDVEKMTIPEMTHRLERFFKDQDYVSKQLMDDLEATDLQLEIVKGKRISEDVGDGRIKTKLLPIDGAERIGVAVVRPDSVDEEAFSVIQDKAENSGYAAVLVYTLGRTISASKINFVKRLNERGSRFKVMRYRDYYKELRYVEQQRRFGRVEDVIQPKLRRLGIGGVDHAQAGKKIGLDSIGKNTPLRIRTAKLLEIMQLGKNQKGDSLGNLPVLRAFLPGGKPLNVFIVSSKGQKQEAVEFSRRVAASNEASVIVSDELFTKTEQKTLADAGIPLWSGSFLDTQIKDYKKSKTAARTQFLRELVSQLGLINKKGFIDIFPGAGVEIFVSLSEDQKQIISCKIVCAQTDHVLLQTEKYPIRNHTLAALGLPSTSKIIVRQGFAPRDAKKENVSVPKKTAAVSFGKDSGWAIKQGVLEKKRAKSIKGDSLLDKMRKNVDR